MSKNTRLEVPTSTKDFRKLREENFFIIDKSLMIKEFIDRKKEVTLITRPRRFGKTLNLSMLAEFFDITKDSKAIFEGLEIMNTEYISQMNTYPTIFLSFADAKGSKEEVIAAIKNEVWNAYRKYVFILDTLPTFDKMKCNNMITELNTIRENNIKYVIDAISFLMDCLKEYYDNTGVMLFIDEYDTPFIEAQVGGFYEDVGDLGAMLGESLKTSTSLKYAMLTGIQRVAKENIFSGLNNMQVYDVSRAEYAKYFGFTEKEVKKAFSIYDIAFTSVVKDMYDGYHIGNYDIYNPWSIMNYMDTRELLPYWVNTGSNHLIIESMKQASVDFNREFDILIETGKLETEVIFSTSFFEVSTRPNLWGLFVNAGYLTIVETIDSRNKEYCLRIPNEEVAEEFKGFTATRLAVEEDSLSNLFKFLQKKEMDIFLEKYQEILSTNISYYDLKSENSYHMLLLGMSLWMKNTYEITSNHERGNGRYDILLKSKKETESSIVIEIKYTKDSKDDLEELARKGIQQINDNHYVQGISPVIKISLAHYGKEVAMIYEK